MCIRDSTGSSRRQSYKFAPTSRMTNTFIAPGNDKVEDIIKSIDDGPVSYTHLYGKGYC